MRFPARAPHIRISHRFRDRGGVRRQEWEDRLRPGRFATGRAGGRDGQRDGAGRSSGTRCSTVGNCGGRAAPPLVSRSGGAITEWDHASTAPSVRFPPWRVGGAFYLLAFARTPLRPITPTAVPRMNDVTARVRCTQK
ncbi:hypothetical protein GCM10010363_05160 [Streptomyces omiyaensis]|nr:hypothetical protein GCM10010363_05160 [Streptomyces omiyaensis]